MAASAAFAAAVLRQYLERRKPYQLAWGIALSMFSLASLALTVGVAGTWTPLGFKLYYLFGAVLNVPWLGLGTVLLQARAPLTRAYLAALALFSLAGVVLVLAAQVGGDDLAGKVVPEGRAFLPPAVRAMALVGNIAGTAVVVGGAAASGLALRHRRELRPRFEGTLLIALGVLLAAAGGVFAFLSRSDQLATGLALGACAMFLGFRRASAPPAAASRQGARQAPGTDPDPGAAAP